MKIETYYECPICHSSWSTRNIAYWGEKQAAELARKCEQEHEAKGAEH